MATLRSMWLSKMSFAILRLRTLLTRNFQKCSYNLPIGRKFYSSSPSESNYSIEESNKIIEIINKTDDKDFEKYSLTKVQLRKVLTWKIQYGTFNSIDQITTIKGFDKKILEKFLQDIDNETTGKKKLLRANKRPTHLTVPSFNEKLRQQIKSLVALHFSVSKVSWTRIELSEQENSPSTVTHWQHYDLVENRIHINDLVKQCLYLDHLIPKADCYILENPQVAQPGTPGNAAQVNINVQKSQLIGIVSFALAKRNSAEKSNIFYLKRFLSSRLFNTLIGTERISNEQVVQDLLRTHYNESDMQEEESDQMEHTEIVNIRGNINVPSDLRIAYSVSEGYQRDFLGQSLLVGMTFLRLCLLDCPKSRSLIS